MKNKRAFYFLAYFLVPTLVWASLPTHLENGVIADPYLYPKVSGNLLGNSTYKWAGWFSQINGSTVTGALLDQSLSTGHIFLGDNTSTAQKVLPSGDVTITSAGTTAIAAGAVDNAKIAAGASIAVSKIAPQTADKAAYFDSSGFLAPSVASSTALARVANVTSDVQAQLDSKFAAIAPFDSAPNAYGITVSGSTFNLEPANASFPGGVSTGTQDIPGKKTMLADLTIGANLTLSPTVNVSLSGSNARVPSHTTSNLIFTNSGLVSIASANNGGVSGGHTIQLTNAIGAGIRLVDNYAGAAAGEKIYTGTGADLLMPDKSQVWLQYSDTLAAWVRTSVGDGGVTAVGTIDSQAPSADGLVVGGSTVYAQSATTSFPGGVSTGTQSFAGPKNFTGALTESANGAASTPGLSVTGTPYTAGSATTNKPQALFEATGTTSTGWSTLGTMLGVNGSTGFSGHLMALQNNGARQLDVFKGGKFIYKMPANNTDEFCLEAFASTTQWCWFMNGNNLGLEQGTNTTDYYVGSWHSFGATGATPLYLWDFNFSSTNVSPDTAIVRNSGSSQPILTVRNTSATANNWSALNFTGASSASTSPDSAIVGRHVVHTNGAESGQLEFYTRSGGGAFSKRAQIDKDGAVAIYNTLAIGGTTTAVTQQASGATSPYTVTWPTAQGGASTVMTNDGAGNLSWASVSGLIGALASATKTSSYSLTNSDDIVYCDSLAPIIITLHNPATATAKMYRIKNINAGECTVYSTSLIDGDAYLTLLQNDSATLFPKGATTWALH
jgi:hypothetical protein